MGGIKGLLRRLRGRRKLTQAYVERSDRFGIFAPQAQDTDALLKLVAGDVYAVVSLIASATAEAAVPELFVKKSSPGQKFTRKTAPLTPRQANHLKRHTPFISEVENAEAVLEHPILDLLTNVNPLWSRFDFFETWSMYADTARVFIYVVKDAMGVPGELWPLPPAQMRPVFKVGNLIDHWLWGNFPNRVRFETDEIIFHRRVGAARDPLELVMGIPPLAAGANKAEASSRLNEHLNNLLGNRAVPDLLVTVMGANDTKIERVREAWRGSYSGQGIGRTAVIGEEVKVQQLGHTLKDMEYIKASQAIRESIANIFHLPISILTSDAIGRANAEAGLYQLAKMVIQPRLLRIAETLNQTLVPMFEPSGSLFLTFRDPVPEDKEFAVEENVRYVETGIITPNEARESVGRDALPGGDELRTNEPAVAAAPKEPSSA